MDLLKGSHNGNYPPENVLDYRTPRKHISTNAGRDLPHKRLYNGDNILMLMSFTGP